MSAYDVPSGFDLDAFLAQPLVAHVATNGPTIRPVWYLWEQGAFWWLTGSWSRLPDRLRRDPAMALVVDTWDASTGVVMQLIASGRGEVVPFDADRARRKLIRYLGDDESRWDEERFVTGTFDEPSAAFVRLLPDRLTARDLSYRPP
jgi:nitroimidazol reductase NimA-like FMN-containing flavoprotein (pyridoxamine 5'-phosphate oxidase superfamily)